MATAEQLRQDTDKAKKHIKILDELKRIRLPYEDMIDNILRYIYHNRRRIHDNDAGKTYANKGKKTGIDVYDGTALQSLNIASDGLAGYSFSRSFRWFEYTLPGKLQFPRWSGMRAWNGKRMDEYPDVKRWLEDCEDVVYQAFLRSNFYDITSDIIRDCMSIGTVSPWCEEDMEEGRIVFSVPHFRECYIAENRYGMADTVYRLFKYTLDQMVDKFGMEKCEEIDPRFKEKLKKNPFDEMEILHCVYPRKNRDYEKLDKKNKPIASVWILKDKTKILLESGYDESPFITWRWTKNNDEWYGRSPAWDAYVDVMISNQQGKSNLVAGHKMTDPPMQAPADLRGKVNRNPGGWTWIDGSVTKDRVAIPLYEGLQVPFSVEMQDRYDEKIREFFHVDFFLLLSQKAFEGGPELKVLQIQEMQAEKAALLGPRIGRMESELANPIHDRVFSIEKRAGRIPEPPEILADYAGDELEVDYMGPMSQAQKNLFKTRGIMSGIEALQPMSEMFPEVLDIINPDITAEELLKSTGFPAKALNDKDVIKKIRQIREERRQLEEQIAQLNEGAKRLPQLGKAPEEGSPLDELMQ